MSNSSNYLSNNGVPRRNRIDLAVPQEVAIREALDRVEKSGAHPRLTDASVLLMEALAAVADWAEETGNVIPERCINE